MRTQRDHWGPVSWSGIDFGQFRLRPAGRNRIVRNRIGRSRASSLKHGGRKFPNWECLFAHRGNSTFLSVYVDDTKLDGMKCIINPMWKPLNKEVELGDQTSFLDHENLVCTQRQCELSKDFFTITEPCWNPEFLQEQLKNYHARKICVFLRAAIWKVMHCELTNRTTQQL